MGQKKSEQQRQNKRADRAMEIGNKQQKRCERRYFMDIKPGRNLQVKRHNLASCKYTFSNTAKYKRRNEQGNEPNRKV